MLFNGGVFKAEPAARAAARRPEQVGEGREGRAGADAARAPTSIWRWPAGRRTTAWCAAARACASAAARPGPTTSASRPRCRRCPACRRRSRPCASCRSAWRKAPRPTCPARSSAWSSASRSSSASSARRVRRDDAAGTLVEEWEGEIEELSPVSATLEGQARAASCRSTCTRKVTEVGQLELWCHQPRRQGAVEAGVQRAGEGGRVIRL